MFIYTVLLSIPSLPATPRISYNGENNFAVFYKRINIMNVFRVTFFAVFIFATHMAFCAKTQRELKRANEAALAVISRYYREVDQDFTGTKFPLIHEKLLQSLLPIIKQGIDPHLVIDQKGEDLFSFVSFRCPQEAVEELLKQGACVNTQSAVTGKTALMRACSAGRCEIVKVLLAAGANRTLADELGYTARDWAIWGAISELSAAQNAEQCLILLDAKPS